jgi:mono/diheme cytochrome c family protein
LTLLVIVALPVGVRAQPLFSATQDPGVGRQLFNVKGCARCHAVNGVGGTIGPDLGRVVRPRTFFDLSAALWNHAPRMAARMRQLGIVRPALTAAEAGDLAAYLFTLHYFDRPGRPSLGKRLFAAKGCVTCHRVGGAGGTAGPDLGDVKMYASPIAIAASMWNHGPKMTAAMAARNVPRPTFTGSELVDLIAYINAASPKPTRGQIHVLPGRARDGRRVFQEKRCVVCHQQDPAGDGPPDLAERAAQVGLVEFAAAMWNKAPLMTRAMESRLDAVPHLRPDEFADLVAYLYSVRYFKQAGDARRGVITAVNRGCLDCHALHGERGKVASDLTTVAGLDTPAGVLAGLWRHSVIDDPRPRRDQRPWPTFTGEEMADLVAYLHTLTPTR